MLTSAYRVVLRLAVDNRPGMFANVARVIGEQGGSLGVIDLVEATPRVHVRDVTVDMPDEASAARLADALQGVDGIEVRNISDAAFRLHEGGKVEVRGRISVRTKEDLSLVYTPAVARVSSAIARDPSKVWTLTARANSVAIVSNGTAVLGLGDIGPLGALPVMEGKALLFRDLAGISAFPLVIDARTPEAVIDTVIRVAPSFGGINLEDIAAPACFEIERELRRRLDIPVFHDDQHGTAIVVLAALSNALRIVGKEIGAVRVIFSGVGAAGVACTRLLMAAGAKRIVGCDSRGAIYRGRAENMNPAKQWYAEHTNPENVKGALADALAGADVFIGVSAPGLLRSADIKRMAKRAIVFALANPEPEIRPEEAGPFAAIMATGRSDYPNQINNVLAFPCVFRGALDVHASRITEGMKLAAAKTIAEAAGAPLRPDAIVPSTFAPGLAQGVARAVREAAVRDGVAGTRGDRIAGTDELHSPAGRP